MFQVPYATMFVFGDFNVHHKDWLNYSGGTDRHGELCYNSSISNDLLRWLTFLRGSLTVTITILLLWISISSDASIYSTRPFPPLGNYDVVVSVSIYFPSNSKRDALFHCVASGFQLTF